MTPTVNEATLRFLESGSYASLSRTVDVIARLLVVGLLVEARAASGGSLSGRCSP